MTEESWKPTRLRRLEVERDEIRNQADRDAATAAESKQALERIEGEIRQEYAAIQGPSAGQGYC